MYVMGGTDGEEVFSDVWRLDLLSLAWTRLALTLPTPLYFHDAALTKVCVFVCLNFLYDCISVTWTTIEG